MSRSALSCLALLALLAAPGARAGSLAFYESSVGPGATAGFDNAFGLVADIDYDASTAESGGIFTFSELEILPFGSITLTDFTCQAVDCLFTFTAGGEGTGRIFVSGGDFLGEGPGTVADGGNPASVYDLGLIDFDAGLLPLSGRLRLTTCNYTSADHVERTCSSHTLVAVPEPGPAALLALGVAGLAARRGGRGRGSR